MRRGVAASSEGVDPALARETWRLVEPLHAMIYFTPEARDRYAELGLRGQAGYFASRAAAFGRASAETVVATFYNFSPAMVRRAIPAAWDITEPETVLAARLAAVDAALRRVLGPLLESPEVAEAADLARRAAEAAGEHPSGRPLFAAHTRLDWPDEPHLVLWHAQTLLREFRGDGHVAALTVEGIGGLEALVLHAATGTVPVDFLKSSRGWSAEDWAAAEQELRARGLLEPGAELALTDAGRAQREWLEHRTDQLSVPAYRALGVAGCVRLGELARPLSRAVVDAGLLPGYPARS
ncbi:hypothetical protein GTS_33440 [Gandjariella thermophila]|uniref:SalK n=1 Tax=Gandjariella thermophila TaxID=1931992 RepID=A0A4D4J5A6_9PSEU|nr:hypothetical protein GTS_33440 [Gandjariella thermophila]